MKTRIVKKEFAFDVFAKPFKSCHASTVALANDGMPVIACFGGRREGAENVAIWTAKRDVYGKWSNVNEAAGRRDITHWNPELFARKDGSLELFFKIGRKIPTWQTWHTFSYDGGLSWEKPSVLVEGDFGGRGPVKNKPIYLSDGSILAPASHELYTWRAFTDRSTDGGKTWEMSNYIYTSEKHKIAGEEFDRDGVASSDEDRKGGVIQPTLWESGNGRVHMLLRSTKGIIFRSDSDDYGRTWNPVAYDTGLPNNHSGIDLTRHSGGALFLVYTPSKEGIRTPLCLGVSEDNGNTWTNALTFEDAPGEYSYPAIICENDTLHVSYTHKRQNIIYCKVEIIDEA